jgi:hypothetical protein
MKNLSQDSRYTGNRSVNHSRIISDQVKTTRPISTTLSTRTLDKKLLHVALSTPCLTSN